MENILSGLSLELIPGNIGSSTPSGSYLDVNGDGTPDYNAYTRIRSSFKNTAPTVPQNVYASQTADGLTIYWDGATDKETPSHSLRYNLSVKKERRIGRRGLRHHAPLNLADNQGTDRANRATCITAEPHASPSLPRPWKPDRRMRYRCRR